MAISLGPRKGLVINGLLDEQYDSQLRTLLRAFDQSGMVTTVLDLLAAPPGSPANGDAYLVDTSGTGAWVGRDGFVAVWTTDKPGSAGLWEFYAQFDGMLLYNVNTDAFSYSVGGVWTLLATGGGGSTTLAALTDVLLTSPANNDQLTYETSSTKWKNKPLSFLAGGKFGADVGNGTLTTIGVNHGLGTDDILVGIFDISTGVQENTATYVIVDANNINVIFGSAPLTNSKRVVVLSAGPNNTVAGASDVLLTSIADKQILRWETSSSKFKNVDNALAALKDVTITSPATNDLLTWNGTRWVNAAGGGGGGGGNPSFTADGDSLSGWTINGGVSVTGPSTTYTPDQLNKVISAVAGGGAWAFISTGLGSLAGYTIEFDAVVDGASGLMDIMFGASITGVGPMIRQNTAGACGLALAGAWNAPMTVLQFSLPAVTGLQVYHWKITFSAAGNSATWSVDGKTRGQAALTLSGDYIGIYGDTGTAGGSMANIKVYKN